ncbi:MAG: amino acid permease [Patescibacteria group bacterium]|nr:amino acid permease [Patescibacteria group bacterium]
MELKRNLGLLDVFCIASGAMISSGIFVLPGLAHAQAGPAIVVSYFLAGLMALIGLLNVAELATAMPRAGGDYFFVTRTLGPAVGTIGGLLTWFSLSLKSSFALVGMGAFARLLLGDRLPNLSMPWIALALALVFVGLNIVGTRGVARLQVGLVLALLLLMGVYIAVGLPAVRPENFDPVAPKGLPAVLFTTGFVFVSYGGLLKVSSMAEEVRDPGREIPLGMMLALLVVTTCYTLMVVVTTGVLPADKLDGSLTPISDGAAVFMGSWGARLMGGAAVLAFISTANAGILAASRYLVALSRDDLAPPALKRINARFHTPHVAVFATGAVVASALFLDLKILVEGASTVLILSYALSCLCVIIVRESRLQNYRPRFQAPLYPWLQILGLGGFLLLILAMGIEAYLIAFALIAIGFCTYWFYGRARVTREYALLHLLERITSRQLVTGTLESELKAIIRERDTIVLDHFDRLVEECAVLDLPDAMSRDAFFDQAAGAMANRVGLAADVFRTLLVAREEESSTALTPEFAIPHVVFGGEGPMKMLIARCKPGIHFNDDAPAVHAVVVLAGSKADRNLHLRSLTAIAQIVRSEEFDARWVAARDEQSLRDVFLLGERRRES